MSHNFEQVGKESDNKERDVGIDNEEVEVEEADEDGECFWADEVGNESDDTDRDVGIDDEEVEVEEADDDAGEECTQARLPLQQARLTPLASSSTGPKWASRTGSRPRPWNKPNTTVRPNTLDKEHINYQ